MKYLTIFMLLMPAIAFAGTSLEDLKVLVKKEMNIETRPYSTRDFGRDKYANAVSFLVPEKDSKSTLMKVRKIIPSDAKAFVGTTRNLSADKVDGVEIVILATNDKFDILRASNTDGINYGLTNNDLIEKLKSWDSKYNIDIWQAGTDTVQITLSKLPSDLNEFSQEIYGFCPDIVDQGSGNISDIAGYLKHERAVFLWWD